MIGAMHEALYAMAAVAGFWIIVRDVLDHRRASWTRTEANAGRGRRVRLRGVLILAVSFYAAGLGYVFLPLWTVYAGGIGILCGAVMIFLGSYWDARSRRRS